MIRLIEDDGQGRLSLVSFDDDAIPQYAILSHTWGADDEEVTFKDMIEGTGRTKEGHKKIEFCRKQAISDNIPYFWVDTCCIDKSSSAELQETINSMFQWYRNAKKCYVFLSDVSISGSTSLPPEFECSKWFRRGWTLQELLAPTSVEFFSQEGQFLGSKKSLESDVHGITGISIEALDGTPLAGFGVEERFSWTKGRETKRPEDQAYSLLGIFGICMPLLYAEGREQAFKRLREEIDKSTNAFTERARARPNPSSMVPFRRDVDFVDRVVIGGSSTLMMQIENKCHLPAARVALAGIGGTGKSQLAIEFCHRLRQHSPETWVFWIYASNIDRLEQGYREVAERLEITGREDPKQNVFELVAKWLRDEANGKWLLVLDNFDDETLLSLRDMRSSPLHPRNDQGQQQESLLTYLPQSEHGAILITTRTRDVALKLVEASDVISISPMTNSDAIQLLRRKLEISADHRDLELLVGVLEYMPLAIVQAAAFIRQRGTGYSVRRYVEAFQRNEKQQISLLNHEAGQLRRDPEAKSSIIVTCQLSFDDLKRKWPPSADLLSLMSYFDRHGIPAKALKAQIRSKTTEEEVDESCDKLGGDIMDEDKDDNENYLFEESMDRLRNYSFVSIGQDGETFEMHALVQLATRKWHEMHGEDQKWRAEFCMKLNAILPQGKYEYWSQWEPLFPHAKSAEKYRPKEDLREWAVILQKAGSYARTKGYYPEAERMCTKSVETFIRRNDEDGINLSFSLNSLARVYRYQGRLREAEKIDLKVLKTRRRVLGDTHYRTLGAMANLALPYQRQGRWKEAEEIEVQVLKGRRESGGEECTETLLAMNNLAATYMKQDRLEAAEKLQLRAIEASRRIGVKSHYYNFIGLMHNRAYILEMQGRVSEAVQIMTEVNRLQSEDLGPKHHRTLSAKKLLAQWIKRHNIDVQANKPLRLDVKASDSLTSEPGQCGESQIGSEREALEAEAT